MARGNRRPRASRQSGARRTVQSNRPPAPQQRGIQRPLATHRNPAPQTPRRTPPTFRSPLLSLSPSVRRTLFPPGSLPLPALRPDQLALSTPLPVFPRQRDVIVAPENLVKRSKRLVEIDETIAWLEGVERKRRERWRVEREGVRRGAREGLMLGKEEESGGDSAEEEEEEERHPMTPVHSGDDDDDEEEEKPPIRPRRERFSSSAMSRTLSPDLNPNIHSHDFDQFMSLVDQAAMGDKHGDNREDDFPTMRSRSESTAFRQTTRIQTLLEELKASQENTIDLTMADDNVDEDGYLDLTTDIATASSQRFTNMITPVKKEKSRSASTETLLALPTPPASGAAAGARDFRSASSETVQGLCTPPLSSGAALDVSGETQSAMTAGNGQIAAASSDRGYVTTTTRAEPKDGESVGDGGCKASDATSSSTEEGVVPAASEALDHSTEDSHGEEIPPAWTQRRRNGEDCTIM